MDKKFRKPLVITGVSGFLGSVLAQRAASHWQTYGIYHQSEVPAAAGLYRGISLDIRDGERVRQAIAAIAPAAVIHAAAAADPAFCAANPDLAWEINAQGTEQVALATATVGARLIYLSTDWVFRGDRGNYTEQDDPDPLSSYGRTKFAGEQVVRAHCDNYCIARVALVFGFGLGRRLCFAEQLLQDLQAGRSVKLFQDEYRSPIYLSTLCDSLLELVSHRGQGIYHLCGSDRLSRLDFGLKLAEVFDFDRTLIAGMSYRELPFPEPRPADCSMRSIRAPQELTTPFPSLTEALQVMRRHYEEKEIRIDD